MLDWFCEAKSMRAGIKRFLVAGAAFAIALQTALWGIAPTHAALPVDPFTVICHSEASGPTDRSSDEAPLSPSHACEHCNLCTAFAPPLPPDTALAANLGPTRTLQILRPVNIARHDGSVVSSNLARGPPAFA